MELSEDSSIKSLTDIGKHSDDMLGMVWAAGYIPSNLNTIYSTGYGGVYVLRVDMLTDVVELTFGLLMKRKSYSPLPHLKIFGMLNLNRTQPM